MGIVAGGDHTADLLGKTIREDLSDVISMISPYDTPFFSMLQTVAATSTKHEWLRDDLTAVSPVGAIEGDDHSGAALEVPTRVINYTQILRKDFAVTGTNETVAHAGMASQFSYQMMKALRELARNTEQALLCQAELASAPQGADGTKRTMNGLAEQVAAATTYDSTTDAVGVALATSGTEVSVDEAAFNALLQAMWEAGAAPDTVLAHPVMKKDISAFAASSIARFNVGKNELVKNVLQYESDFGTVEVFLERFTPVGETTSDTADPTNQDRGEIHPAKDGTHTSFAFERQHLRKAVLRPTVAERLPKSGDSERGMVLHELTLEVGASGAVGMWGNIKND